MGRLGHYLGFAPTTTTPTVVTPQCLKDIWGRLCGNHPPSSAPPASRHLLLQRGGKYLTIVAPPRPITLSSLLNISGVGSVIDRKELLLQQFANSDETPVGWIFLRPDVVGLDLSWSQQRALAERAVPNAVTVMWCALAYRLATGRALIPDGFAVRTRSEVGNGEHVVVKFHDHKLRLTSRKTTAHESTLGVLLFAPPA